LLDKLQRAGGMARPDGCTSSGGRQLASLALSGRALQLHLSSCLLRLARDALQGAVYQFSQQLNLTVEPSTMAWVNRIWVFVGILEEPCFHKVQPSTGELQSVTSFITKVTRGLVYAEAVVGVETDVTKALG
jgi:hypothetical protein